MNRDVCGICWGAYDENGQCECIHAPVVRDDTALLRQALDALDCILSPLCWREIDKVDAAIVALKERLSDPCTKVEV
jgi:hypothetical protein